MPLFIIYDTQAVQESLRVFDAETCLKAQERFIEQRFGVLEFAERSSTIVVTEVLSNRTKHRATVKVTYTKKPQLAWIDTDPDDKDPYPNG
jgi:hypothetical protein